MKYILALDQGTTSSRAVIFDQNAQIISVSQKEYPQIYPKAGWVEQNPWDILDSQMEVAQSALEKAKLRGEDISAIGITNQRETTILWDRETGRPIYNAIVWQCKRTSEICKDLQEKGYEELFKKKTGLVIDAYFSATKIKWILDNVPEAKEKAQKGELAFGTVDTWLLWNLTDGRVHATDVTNASRTMLFNIKEEKWDEEILNILEIPSSILPQVKENVDAFGETHSRHFSGAQIPIMAMAGDQQSALFGQLCVEKGSVKNTYGTGCFMLMNTDELVYSKHGLLSTIAWKIKGKTRYALEGSVFNAGSAIQWLRDELRLVYDAPQSEYYANMVDHTQGVVVVPTFSGIGAPYWDMDSRGAIFGLTRATKREHIVRATLEAICYRTKDIIKAMEEDAGFPIKDMKVDGGACANNFLMQFQSDILHTEVHRPKNVETTVLGVFYMTALGCGIYKNLDEIRNHWELDRKFLPTKDEKWIEENYNLWKRAIERSLGWIQ